MAYNSETDKIDKLATSGLAGTNNSLAYRVHEIERHLHSYERWFGLAVAPNAEVHRADKLSAYTNTNIVAPFTVDAGNDNYGSWVQILGSSDTPVDGTNPKFDIHSLAFSANERSGAYIFQIAFGATAAQALIDGTYTMVTTVFDAANYGSYKNLQHKRASSGTKVWVRCLCPGQNTGTVSFYFGLHEYEG